MIGNARAYWANFTGGLGYIVHAQREIRYSLVNAESLLELFQRTPTVKNGADQFKLKSGTIQFQDVGFSYDGKKETIQDFTFYAGPGQKIALVGETGGGKSTVLKLLFRFYDVQHGKILIDDQDITGVTLHSLRQCIGVVPQDPALFNDSVMENVRYSKLGASDEEVIEACKGAAIHDKILTFTEGYQTIVGENGVKLSGGELQRIAIARVILKNPEIILLDEATSAVDTETEAHIQDALEKLAKGRTTITIAHRLSTVTNADIIVVIKGGKLVEQGSPQALLKAKGKFSELWLRQVGINPTPKEDAPTADEPVGPSDTLKTTKIEGGTRMSEASLSSAKSLRPTAPEFVPQKIFVSRDQRGKAAKGSPTLLENHIVGQSHDVSTTKANGSAKKPQQKGKDPGDLTIGLGDSDSQWDTADSKLKDVSGIKSKKKRLTPAQRRQNNKSDPSGSASKVTQEDGASEGATLKGINGAPPIGRQSRRVSAPSGPLSSITNNREGGRPSRRRAQRWHQRKRQPSGQALGTTSGEGSGALSGDTLHSPTPVVRLPNSTDHTPPICGVDSTGPSNTSVHFAPGF